MKKLGVLLAIAVLVSVSCKKKKETEDVSTNSDNTLKQEVVNHYATLVHTSYSDALDLAEDLQDKIDLFVAAPDSQKLLDCKAAWLAARQVYGQTEVYRFYGGPIDDDNGPEGRLNAWPLDEAYIDYTSASASSGIINNLSYTIDKETLSDLNEAGGDANISVGFHAIEFLLWGQDTYSDSPGKRYSSDYKTTGGTASNQDRRGAYLKVCAELLVEDLQYLVDAWAPSANNYRKSFTEGNLDEALKNIIQGMGFLSKGELAAERLIVALDQQDQEHEHSCFSDNTHNDVFTNAQGILNVWNGIYEKSDGQEISGKGLAYVVAGKNSALTDETGSMLATSVGKCALIQAPFDQEILASNSAGRARVQAAIDALNAQADKLVEVAEALGLGNITVE